MMRFAVSASVSAGVAAAVLFALVAYHGGLDGMDQRRLEARYEADLVASLLPLRRAERRRAEARERAERDRKWREWESETAATVSSWGAFERNYSLNLLRLNSRAAAAFIAGGVEGAVVRETAAGLTERIVNAGAGRRLYLRHGEGVLAVCMPAGCE